MEDARRQRLLQLSAAGVFLAIIIVVVVIIVAGSGGGDSGVTTGGGNGGGVGRARDDHHGAKPSSLAGKAEVAELLAGIPQSGTLLGKPDAPVKVSEYGDLQCPFYKENAEGVTPEVIEHQVRGGEASIDFNQFIIIGPDSIPAGEAALAAGTQGKAWNFIELFYRNQGEENSGYVTDEFIESVGKEAGIPDLAKWNKERKSGKFKKTLEAQTKKAQKLGLEGTPSFAIEGPKTKGLELLDTPETSGQLEEAIEQAS